MDYDEDEVLTSYIWRNYYHLLNPLERFGAKAVALREKEGQSGEIVSRSIRERWAHESDPAVVEALKDGPDVFRRRVRDRILREELENIVINRCPTCGRIIRTPRARQCLWCGHDWH